MDNKKDRIVILDFDHCIFNTTRFVAALRDRYKAEFGISSDAFMKYRQAIKDCCTVIDIDTFVKKIPHDEKGKLHAAIHDVIRKTAAACIFPDVVPFFERHKDQFDLLVETHGDAELQAEKIRHSKLPPYVAHVVSLEAKDAVVGKYIRDYREVHFIDDKTENIDMVKTAHPSVMTYFIQRPEDHPYADRPSACDCADRIIYDLTFTLS